jgi:hypothetical protein
MKKLLLSSFVMVFAVYAYGQGLSGGAKGGLNIANQKYSSDGVALDTKARPGILVGGYLVYMINEKFGVQPEVLFSMQGSKWDFSGDDSKFKFNYINIPILARYNITEMISVHAGPQFGLLLSADLEDEDGDQLDIKDDIKGVDVAGATGVEVELPNGLGFGARYVLGFTNNIDTDDPDIDELELKNRVIQLYVFYKLFGKK